MPDLTHDVLELLVCPACHSAFTWDYEASELVCTGADCGLAYPLKGAMEDRKLRIPDDPQIRADLRKVQKVTTAAGNIRFVAESTPDGHADRFWALALAIHAAEQTPGDAYAASRPRTTTTRTDLAGY